MEVTEQAEIEAIRDLFAACPEELEAAHGIATLALDDALAFRVPTLPGVGELNHALAVSSAGQIDALASFYGETVHIVSVLPGVDLDGALAARDYERGYGWMKFRRGVEPLPTADTDLKVVEVGAEAGGDFAVAFCTGYGLPASLGPWLAAVPGRKGWHCFVAYDGDEPAAAGALHVHEQTGWLGMAATVAAYRRRGAQNAILAARIARAAAAGCTAVVTETGERVEGRPSDSYRNILRNGFTEAYLRPNWRRAAG